MSIDSRPRSIDAKALEQLLADGLVTLVDVRDSQEFAEHHIPGAVNIPTAELADRKNELPAGVPIVAVCKAGGRRSSEAAARLTELGFGDVAMLEGGTAVWDDAAAARPANKALNDLSFAEIQTAVAERYGLVATSPKQKFNFPVGRKFAESVGYDPAMLDRLPAGTWESFTGAGNPHAFVDARAGEVLLDLGCGAGLDLYLYAQKVMPGGRLYGLDLALPMLDKAKSNLASVNVSNIGWLHAPADRIPLPDNSIDIVTANGIYNLSADKDAVMREVARVLKPGGRTIFAEIMLKAELPQEVRREINDWFRCIGGALVEGDFLRRMESHGFANPQVLWRGRNARTGHELATCAVIRVEKL